MKSKIYGLHYRNNIPLPASRILRGFVRPEKNSGPAAGRFTNRLPCKGDRFSLVQSEKQRDV